MPTPSETFRNADFGLRSERPRSVYPNFKSESDGAPVAEEGLPEIELGTRPGSQSAIRNLQSEIDLAVARSFLYQFLAQTFAYPTEENWRRLAEPEVHTTFTLAVSALGGEPNGISAQATELASGLKVEEFELFLGDYIAVFGHAARGSCPLNEIEYGDLKADPLFQPHRLADLAAYYRAFGLEIAEDATERPDHICVELELMAVLTAKEAYAWEHQLDDADLSVCQEAQRNFLREHLGRWTPAFTRRLAQAVGASVLGSLARFTEMFLAAECRLFELPFGSEELMLRPVDETDESLCTTCGIRNLPPGAMTAT